LSRERKAIAEAEAVGNVEGNMSGPTTRGAGALPWSQTISRTKGSGWNLGDLMPDHRPWAVLVRIGKARSRSR
jgi:hypothetical protein